MEHKIEKTGNYVSIKNENGTEVFSAQAALVDVKRLQGGKVRLIEYSPGGVVLDELTIGISDLKNSAGEELTGGALTWLRSNTGKSNAGTTAKTTRLDGTKGAIIADSYWDLNAQGGESSALPYLRELMPNVDILDKSTGGSTVTPYSNSPVLSYWERLQDPDYLPNDLDWVILETTSNDWGIQPAIPLGYIGEDLNTTPTTYVNSLMQCVLNLFNRGVDVYFIVHNTTGNNRNTSSTQRKYIDAALQVGNYYNLQMTDLSSTLGATFENASNVFTDDLVHLNEPYKKKIAYIAYNMLNTSLSSRSNPQGIDPFSIPYPFTANTTTPNKIYDLEQRIIGLGG